MTANQSYQNRINTIKSLVSQLQTLVAEHAQEQAQKPADWSFDGDLSYVEGQLVTAVKFLRGEED